MDTARAAFMHNDPLKQDAALKGLSKTCGGEMTEKPYPYIVQQFLISAPNIASSGECGPCLICHHVY